MVQTGNFRARTENFRLSNGTALLWSDRDLSTMRQGDHKNITVLKICTLNIQHAGNAKLETATRALDQMGVDVAILTETKLPKYNTIKSSGYDITHTAARSNSIGGAALCVRKSPWFHVESTKAHGHNVISTHLVTGRKRWLLIGIYIPPSETDHTTVRHALIAARESEKYNIPIIMIGDLNIDLDSDNRWGTIPIHGIVVLLP